MADYNINAVTRRVVFTGSAGVGPYAFSFEVLDENDVAVYFNTTKLTLTTDYTVTVNANGTGSVTIVTGTNVPSTPTASDTIIIIGARDIERVTDFVTAGDLLASSLNEQLDALTIFDQQIAEEGKRSMRAPVYDPALVEDGGTLDMTLPPKADRVDTVMAFDTNGNPVKGPTVSGITTITDLAADIKTLADIEDGTVATDAISDTAAIAANVTTVAGISANVTAVAGNTSNINAVAADATDIGTVATNIASVNTVATNISDVITVANDLNEAISEVETVADDLNEAVSEIDTVATNIADVQTVGTDLAGSNTIGTVATNIADVNTVATNIADVSTTASNIAGVNSFAERYRVGATDPTTSLDEGDLFFNTTSNEYKFYDGSAWQTVNVTGLGNIVEDISPQLGGDLDVQTNSIVSTSNQDINITPNGTGSVVLDGLSYPQADGTAGQFLKTDGAGQLAFETVNTDLSNDTTPQLGGDLDVNGNSIVSASNGDIAITPNGTGSIVLDGLNWPTSDGSAGQLLKTDGAGQLSFGAGGMDWSASPQTSSFTAEAGKGYFVDTSSSAITVTLPASPSTGDRVAISDYKGNASSNNITIEPNGSKFGGNTSDFDGKVTTDNLGLMLIYSDATQGWIRFFADVGSEVLLQAPTYNANILVAAGGGGGGSGHSGGGGGGGAGGYITNSSKTLNTGTTYTVTVGAGGAGSTGTGASGLGSQGGNSSLTGETTAIGGGGGGYAVSTGAATTGGSGGGGGGNASAAGAAGTSGQGNAGGAAAGTGSGASGGGGGGSGGAGQSGVGSAHGGAGTSNSITGSAVSYAGGGGGGAFTSSGGTGNGGGGNGGGGTNAGANATDATGGGGGGGGQDRLGGDGGNGVVIISVPTANYSGTTTGSPTVTTSGSNTIMKFTASGSYTA